jgi:hypothetical protein
LRSRRSDLYCSSTVFRSRPVKLNAGYLHRLWPSNARPGAEHR